MARKLCVGYNEYYKMISMKNIIKAYKNARKGNTRHDYEVSPYNEFILY